MRLEAAAPAWTMASRIGGFSAPAGSMLWMSVSSAWPPFSRNRMNTAATRQATR